MGGGRLVRHQRGESGLISHTYKGADLEADPGYFEKEGGGWSG